MSQEESASNASISDPNIEPALNEMAVQLVNGV
jgi:hypothetical protein